MIIAITPKTVPKTEGNVIHDNASLESGRIQTIHILPKGKIQLE